MNTLPINNHIKLAEKTPLLRYNRNTDFEEHREKCIETLRDLLGMDEFVKCDPDFNILEDGELNGNRHIHFILQTEEGYYTHCDMLLPKEQTKPLPLCVCLQGHSKGSHISLGQAIYPGDEETIQGGDRDFAVRAVKEGYAALAIEQRAFGRCGGTEYGPACDRPVLTGILLGRTVIGERIWDISRVLDTVEAHFSDITTMKDSVLMGNSGGGTATYYAACIEHRFDAFMPSCAFCTYLDSIIKIPHCSCNYIPRIAKYFDMGDLAIMIAPKKLVIVSGKDDNIFPIDGAKKMFDIVKELYTLAGSPENCAHVIGNGGHRFYADDGWSKMKELLKK